VGLGLLQNVGVIILTAMGIVRSLIYVVGSFFYIFRSRRDLANLDGVQITACKSGAAAAREHSDEESGSPPTSQQTWHHAFVIPTYLESSETTRAVLHSLAEQQYGLSKRIIVVVSFEEASPGLISAQAHLDEFDNYFEALNKPLNIHCMHTTRSKQRYTHTTAFKTRRCCLQPIRGVSLERFLGAAAIFATGAHACSSTLFGPTKRSMTTP